MFLYTFHPCSVCNDELESINLFGVSWQPRTQHLQLVQPALCGGWRLPCWPGRVISDTWHSELLRPICVPWGHPDAVDFYL